MDAGSRLLPGRREPSQPQLCEVTPARRGSQSALSQQGRECLRGDALQEHLTSHQRREANLAPGGELRVQPVEGKPLQLESGESRDTGWFEVIRSSGRNDVDL